MRADRNARPHEGVPPRGDRRARARRRLGRHCRGRVRRGDGPVGLGQVDVHERRRLPRRADLGHLPVQRRGRRGTFHRRAGRHPEPLDRVRVPAVQPARAHVGAGQRRAAVALRRRPGAGAPCPRVAEAGAGRARHPLGSSSRPTVRRPAAARRHRARARQRPQADPRRRAHGRPRFGDEPRSHGAAAGAQPLRHHDRRRHARAGHRDVRVAADRVPRRQDRLRHAQRACQRGRRTPRGRHLPATQRPRAETGGPRGAHELPCHAARRAGRPARQQAALRADDAGHHHRRRRGHHDGRRRRRRAGARRGPDQEPGLQPHHRAVGQLHDAAARARARARS